MMHTLHLGWASAESGESSRVVPTRVPEEQGEGLTEKTVWHIRGLDSINSGYFPRDAHG